MDGIFAQFVAELLLAAQMLSGYPMPAAAPEVALIPRAELQRAACGRPCKVFGWFPPGNTIYLDDRLDPLNSLHARGILVHEMVHYLQQESGAHGTSGGCAGWLSREREAYDIQMRWLAAQPNGGELLVALARWPARIDCRDLPDPARAAYTGGG